MLIESPIVGGALNVAAEQVVDYSAYGRLLPRSLSHVGSGNGWSTR
jgi:hypothetical protein